MVSFFTDSKAAQTLYQQHGYHIEPDVLSQESCQALIDTSALLGNAQNQSFRPEMMPHRQNSSYLTALKHKSIIQIIQQLLGGSIVGLQTEFFFGKPGTPGFALHQDNFFVQAPYHQFVSAWIALTDIYPKKGGLILYPQSHKQGLFPTQKLSTSQHASQDPNANNEVVILPSSFKPITPSIRAGTVIFLHGHIVHGSHTNETNEWRYVLLNTYIRKNAPFRPGNYAKREAIEL